MNFWRSKLQLERPLKAVAIFFRNFAIVLAFTSILGFSAQSTDDALKNILRKEDQRLLTAVQRSDKEVWAEFTKQDFMP